MVPRRRLSFKKACHAKRGGRNLTAIQKRRALKWDKCSRNCRTPSFRAGCRAIPARQALRHGGNRYRAWDRRRCLQCPRIVVRMAAQESLSASKPNGRTRRGKQPDRRQRLGQPPGRRGAGANSSVARCGAALDRRRERLVHTVAAEHERFYRCALRWTRLRRLRPPSRASPGRPICWRECRD